MLKFLIHPEFSLAYRVTWRNYLTSFLDGYLVSYILNVIHPYYYM